MQVASDDLMCFCSSNVKHQCVYKSPGVKSTGVFMASELRARGEIKPESATCQTPPSCALNTWSLTDSLEWSIHQPPRRAMKRNGV